MKPNSISGINFHVQDLARTAEFYEALGFRRGKDEAGRVTFYVNWFFVTFVEDGGRAAGDTGSGISVQIKVDDLDEFFEGVRSNGMKPVGEPEERLGGGREFSLRDPDGYELVFFAKK